MKNSGTFRHLFVVAMLGLAIVSCANKKDNSPFNNQLNGGVNGNNEIITSLTTLEERIEQRFDIDMSLLQNNGRIACKYYCNEESQARGPFNPFKLGCIREYTNNAGQMSYKTYLAKFKVFQNVLDIDGNKGAEIAGASGIVTKALINSRLFSMPQSNIQVQPQPGFLYGIGNFNIYPIITPLGAVGVTPAIPAAANLLENKRGTSPQFSDTWCTTQ